jgi:hypothetical protein
MILYISGPMTGIANSNFPAFHRAARELRAAGYTVISPAEICQEHGLPWAQYLRKDIAELLKCDAVALLPGYLNSKGAMLEKHIAEELGMQVDTVGMWLKEARKCDADRSSQP